jgi:DNA-binding transcriptional MerR regulator
MRYRVDELAARTGSSVDTVRFYQSKELLPPPQREGRIAWYSDDHVERLARIRSLKDKGFTLTSIKRLLDGEVDADAVLATVVIDDGERDRSYSLEELASATGVSAALLQALEREGLLTPRNVRGVDRYSSADANAVTAGLELLGAGLPLGELLDLARHYDKAMRAVAEQAVELFVRFVRDPIHASSSSEDEAAGKLVEAFRKMLPATTSLVASHFERLLLAAARERLEDEGIVGDEGADGE